MPKISYKKLKQLGHTAAIPKLPDNALIEKVPNPFPEYDYLVRFTCPELTTLCPVTGQPDFAHLVIDYAPGKWLVESKSLKLYFESFRNYGTFHETCTVGIGARLIKEIAPKWLRVSGYWYPRGGMPIDVFFQKGKLPANVFVPDQGVAPYRGRG
jgi:7-cyano-7-deazaguanine reductase